MAFPQYVDYAVYQPDTAEYAHKLAINGAKGSFIQLIYGSSYPNNKAGLQLRYSLKYLDFTGIYQFFLGNPVAEAKCFLAQAHTYGMDVDKTTPVMLDVEPNSNYNGPQTYLINKWTDIVYRYGFHNIFIYSMSSWFKDGHIKPEQLKHGHIWAASYGTDEPGVMNASAWQYTDNWCGMHTDGDMLFVPLSIMNGVNYHAKPAKKLISKKPKNNYLKHGSSFKVIGKYANGYKDINLKVRKGTVLEKNSIIDGRIVSCGHGLTRIQTDSGYFSSDTKIFKAV